MTPDLNHIKNSLVSAEICYLGKENYKHLEAVITAKRCAMKY